MKHNLLIVAIVLIARAVMKTLNLNRRTSIAELCRTLDVNRSYAYQKANNVAKTLAQLAGHTPGRPKTVNDHASDVKAKDLTIAVLQYRLDHPGALVPHKSKTTYSPRFRRFILEQLDEWTGTVATFATAARVPVDTLRDWVKRDREGLLAEQMAPSSQPPTPRDASKMARRVLEAYENWQGSTRAFVRSVTQRFALRAEQVRRLLQITGAIVLPERQKPFRYRGTTTSLEPGSMLVTDGKTIAVELTGSATYDTRNWQGIVDQTTGYHFGTVVTYEECSAGVSKAYNLAVDDLPGCPPLGILVDNKPCNQRQSVRRHVEDHGTTVVYATHGRGENKAVIESEFGRFEDRVGTIRLDDSNIDSLIHSAVAEVVRAYTSAVNDIPRAELDGKSRREKLRDHRPSPQQRARDTRFIRQLKAQHDRARQPSHERRQKGVSRMLLDHVFERLDLVDNDPNGKLRDYLSIYDPAAIRRATAIVSAKLAWGDLETQYAHRYLAKVIQSKDEESRLDHASEILLELAHKENEIWTSVEQRDYEQLVRQHDASTLARKLAERAAWGGLPVQATFWTQRLLEVLRTHNTLIDGVKRFLRRFYEAPFSRRLALLDKLCALEANLI